MTRSPIVGVAVISLALLTLCAAPTAAQTPSPPPRSPSVLPSASTSAAATPFPWPTLPPPEQVPVPAPFQPSGPPTASVTRHGIRVELWFSSPTAAPGEWVQAVVRTTNIGDDAAWTEAWNCVPTTTQVTADLAASLAAGEPQSGNAAVFKRMAIANAGDLGPRFVVAPAPSEAGVRVAALAECSGVYPPVRRLRPGASMEERFIWYPAQEVGGTADGPAPLPPGDIEVDARVAFVGRGPSPTRAWTGSHHRPISVSAPLELTGMDPGVPSVPELVDRALADPRFGAWVARDPEAAHWRVAVVRWPSEGHRQPLWTDLGDHAEHGVVEISLAQRPGADGMRLGFVDLDPWTGQVLNVAFQ